MKRLCYPWDAWKESFHNYLSITWHLERFYWHFRLLGNHLRGLLKQLHCIYQNWWYVRANFPDKCDIAQVFKKWNVHQLAYYDVHQITTPDGSCSKLHFHEWCIIIIFWWYTYWNNAYESQLQFFQFFWVALWVVAFMPVTSCRTNNAHLKVFPPYFRIQSFVIWQS